MALSNHNILQSIQQAYTAGKHLLAILLDPDKTTISDIPQKVKSIEKLKADYIFVGGSLLFTHIMDEFIVTVKKHSTLPVIIFPGSPLQISHHADGIMFLQLTSGRNAEYLIGNHVIAAPLLQQTNLEILSTGYILVDSGRETTVSYITQTKPIPAHKPEIAMATALAGQFIGHQLVYLDGGSGALQPIPEPMIEKVRRNTKLPLIVGGGIKSLIQLDAVYEAGATVAVIGTAFEDNLLI